MVSPAANLVGNASFEEGRGGWTVFPIHAADAFAVATDVPPRQGRLSARLKAAGEPIHVQSDPLRVAAEADYTLTFYARTRDGVGMRASLWALRDDDVGRAWNPVSSPTDWAGNLLPNDDFRQGVSSWTLWHETPDGSSGAIEPTGEQGQQAYHVQTHGSAANLHSDPIPCDPGTVYILAVRTRIAKGVGVSMCGWGLDDEGKILSYAMGGQTALPGDTVGYQWFTRRVETSATCTRIKAHLLCRGGDVWWDRCVIVPAAQAAAVEIAGLPELPPTQPGWARFQVVGRTTPGCRDVRIVFSAQSGTLDLDAVQLEPGRDASAFQTGPALLQPGEGQRNIVPNSGFEGGGVGWTLWHQNPGVSGGGTVPAEGMEGSAAYGVSNPGTGGANLFSDPVPCVPGKTYTISAYVRAVEGRDLGIAGWGLDGSGTTISYELDGKRSLPGAIPTFTRFEKTFVAPSGCVGLKAHLVCNGGHVWWDDVQIEEGERSSVYQPGPQCEILKTPPTPEAAAYTRAIIREARLRDVLTQTKRLVLYTPEKAGGTGPEALPEAVAGVARVSSLLHGAYLVPDFRAMDFAAIATANEAAIEMLSAIWRDLGFDPSAAFEEWSPPPLPAGLRAADLAREFLIFPCFTRDLFFRGEGDWALLEPFGFRIVSGWWWAGVQADGSLESSRLDDAVEQCLEHGYRCDITIDGAAAVTSLQAALGEAIYLHNAEGDWSPSGNCHTTVNIWHPEARRAAAAFLTELGAHYARHPGVVSYELTNEPSLTIEKHVHGYEYEPAGVGGYSPEARAAWHAWLARHYPTIEALNAAWRAEYTDFAEIAPPADLHPPLPVDSNVPVPTGPLYDFQSFRAWSHADWFRLCIEALKHGDATKAVISQYVSGPMDRKEGAVDLRLMTDAVPWDMYGTHDWPGDRPGVTSLYAASMNLQANRPHWEDEFIWSQWERKGTPEPVMRAALERNLWRQVAWGKRGISLFNLESEWAHDSADNWNNSLLNIEADLAVPRYSTGVIPTMERKVCGLRETLYASRLRAVDVAILRPSASTLVAAPDLRSRQDGTAVAEHLLGQNMVPIMIAEEHLLEGPAVLSEVKVLITPWATHVPERVQQTVLDWVAAGGHLLASGPFGIYTPHGEPSGILMEAAFGEGRWLYESADLTWRWEPETAEGENTTRVDVPGAGMSLIAGRIGAGSVCVYPTSLASASAAKAVDYVLQRDVPIPLVQTDLERVEIVPRWLDERQLLLFVINLAPRGAVEGQVMVRGSFADVADIACESVPRVPVKLHDGVTEVPVLLEPGGAVVLRLREP